MFPPSVSLLTPPVSNTIWQFDTLFFLHPWSIYFRPKSNMCKSPCIHHGSGGVGSYSRWKGSIISLHSIWLEGKHSLREHGFRLYKLILVGALEHSDYFSIQVGISSSQLTFTPSFFRGVAQNHQPVIIGSISGGITIASSLNKWL